MSGGGFDGAEFRRVLGHFPTGVTVVTAAGADGPEGMAIGSFSSVSLDPPLVMFCPGHESASWSRMRPAGSFCVNVLGDHQADVSRVFAGKSDDRFDGLGIRVEATGAPVIEGCLAWIDCTVHAVHDGGDHDIVVGRVEALGVDSDGAGAGADGAGADAGAGAGPLIFFKGGYGRYQPL